MSYEKQTWAAGDKITSAKLNHMEDGILQSGFNTSGNILILFDPSLDDSLHLSYNEIEAMLERNILPYLHLVEEGGHALAFLESYSVNQDGNTTTYEVRFYTPYPTNDLVFTANDADGTLTIVG